MLLKDVYKTLDAAVQLLAASDASLHDRLNAALAEIARLHDEDFPPGGLRQNFGLLIDQVHTYWERCEPEELQGPLALAILDQFKHLIASTGIAHGERTVFGSVIHHDS